MHSTPTPLVLRGASIVDGTGAPGFVADIAVVDGVITAIDTDLATEGATIVDLDGLVLAPGFIDSHTHDDFAVVHHPDMGFKVLGGVTTCVVGNCGMGAAPHRQARAVSQSFHPDTELPEWEGYGGYLDWLDAHPPSVNVAALIGHGTVRASVMRRHPGPPTDEQMEQMRLLVEEGMTAGCFGMSSGLEYEPGRSAETDELAELAAEVARFGGLYTSHLRNEGRNLVRSVDEAIEIGRRSGAGVVISHLKASGRAHWGTVGEAIDRIRAAQESGQAVAADQYPYTAGSTVLSALVTRQLFVDGSEGSPALEGADVVVAHCPANTRWDGSTLAEIGAELGLDTAATADHVVGVDLRTTVVLHGMSEDDVRTVLATDGIMIGSDGLPTLDGKPHPRLFGTFARVIGHYARDVGLIGVPEAVHRMTGRTAEVFGLDDRGTVAVGKVADLVAFDAERIIDRGTFAEPNRSPDGIVHVWVGGVAVVADGRHTGARPGRALRHRPPVVATP